MAATSRPDMVDVALLRPGRIDKSVYCGFPNEKERNEIINVYLKKFNYKEESNEQKEILISELSRKTEYYTSADLKGIIQNA